MLPKPNAQSVMIETYTKFVFLIFVLFLIFYRAPTLLLEPRFWAEEASVFFRYAYSHGFFESLTFVPKRTAGYFLLVANLPAAVAAHCAPLEYAPFVTTYWALLIQLLPFVIIVWGASYMWDGLSRKIAACFIVLFAPSATGEVWLNTINAQVYCGIISVCIVCENLQQLSKIRTVLYRILLVFCCLSGVYTTFLFGVFCLKAWLEKTQESLIHVGIVFVCSCAQVGIFLWLYSSANMSPKKLAGFEWSTSAMSMLYYQIVLPLIGSEYARDLLSAAGLWPVLKAYLAQDSYAVAIVGVLCVLCTGAILYALVRKQTHQYQLLLIGGFFCVALGTSIFAAGGVPGGRYAVVSGVIVLFLLLANIRFERGFELRSVVCLVALCSALLIGGNMYKKQDAHLYFVCGEGCPKWTDEVQKWKKDPRSVLMVWPYPRWTFRLSKP